MKPSLLFPIVSLVLSGTPAFAASVASASFTGMTVTNATTVNPVVGANDFTWSLITTANTNFDVVTDNGSPGIGGGNSLRIDNSTTGTFRGMIGTMGSSTTINLGETLTLSFTGRYYESPGSNSGGLRFGLINSGNLDNNFYAQLGTGGNTGFALFRDGAGDTSPGGGTGVTTLVSTASGAAYASMDTSPFNATISITRTAPSDYGIVANLNGSIRTASSNTGWDNYNAVFIRNGSISNDFLIDNVVVSIIPEPGSALLGGLGMLALLRRRRA